MAIPLTECGALILAGGRSKRMGCCKATLPIGETTILQHTIQELALFPELLLSANEPDMYIEFQGAVVKDRYINCGPLAGIHAGLCTTEKKYLFCVPCDMPCFTSRLIKPMVEAFQEGIDALICVDDSGNIQPLCGIYSKSALPFIEQALMVGNLRMKNILKIIQSRYFLTTDYADHVTFLNLNTPEEYKQYIKSIKL